MNIRNFSLIIFGIFISCAFALNAEPEGHSQKMASQKPIYIDYFFPPWNKNPGAPDSGIAFLRDSGSGKLVKLNLDEDGANTGHFTGRYAIGWAADGEVTAELYIPPQQMAKNAKIESIIPLIQEGRFPRKPYFLRKEKDGYKMSLYNSANEALEAYKGYMTNLLKALPKQVALPATADPGVAQSAKKVREENERARLADLAKQQEQMRLRLEEEEKRKLLEQQQQQNSLAAEEKERRKNEARSHAKKAMDLFKAQKFAEAQVEFKQSLDLDPSSSGYQFQYGVCLFKTDKYNEAIVAFKMASGPDVNAGEMAYFKGLSHLKLKEYAPAILEFESIKKGKDPEVAATATFFVGVILFAQEKYKEAKLEFEKVIDISKDPKLDTQAETYIEQIANIEQFEAKKAKRFTWSVTTGLTYDSNILLLSDSNSTGGTATDKAGWRGLLTSDLDYRIILTEAHELNATASYVNMYSVNNSFKASADLQKADPLLTTIKLPYKYKGKIGKTALQSVVTPGYETLSLSTTGTGRQTTAMKSNFINTQQTFVIRDDYFTTLGLEFRSDVSTISDSQTASKVALSNNNIWFRDQKKTEAILGNFGYSINTAHGSDETYNKTELSGGYLMPSFWKMVFITQLNLALTKYPKHAQSRSDTNTAANFIWSRAFANELKGALVANYTVNGSNVDSNKYSKYSLMTTLSWGVDF